MKKILKFLPLITLLSLFLISCNKKVTEQEARLVLAKHLENRYQEPFRIGRMYINGTETKTWFEAKIIPERYVGAPKERDSYYQSVGTVRINKGLMGEKLGTGGDVYMVVRLNESANAYFLPKLQELFGEQVLPVMEIRTREIINNGNGMEEIFNHNKSIGAKFYIEGGVYIFCRIDNLEQKNEYRQKIYNFIQYMKSQEKFDYVNLAFYMLDERCLTERFDYDVGENLLIAREELKTADEFLSYRKEQLNTLNNDFNNMNKEKIKTKIEQFNKHELLESYLKDSNKFSTLYHKAIYSSNFLEFESRLSHFKKLNYDSLDEIKLLNTMKVLYREYEKEKLYNNEWDGE